MPECSVFDFTGLPRCLVEIIPTTYFWSVLRAMRVRPDQSCDGGGWEEAAARFERLMGIIDG